jgi:hypothetical protein
VVLGKFLGVKVHRGGVARGEAEDELWVVKFGRRGRRQSGREGSYSTVEEGAERERGLESQRRGARAKPTESG